MKTKDRLKIHWVTKPHEMVANALGYNIHNSQMLKHIEKYADLDETADIALTITPADQFIPVPGKFNVLFSMWEFLDLPETYIQGINKADLILVPCRFCKDVFSRYTKKPIEVCWEGVDPEVYRYHERKPSVPFRFLWVGAPNPRKGYPLILQAVQILEQLDNVEIYIKTTVPKIKWGQFFRNIWNKRHDIMKERGKLVSVWRMLQRLPRPQLADKVIRYGKKKNIIFDTRKLPINELIELYNSAHCFVLPSFGEGWGLTLCEAMATGAPCVATKNTGTADFFDEQVGYVVEHGMKELDLRDYKLKTRGYEPSGKSTIEQMFKVMREYPEALRRGRAASRRILEKFTWDRSAKRLHDILRRHAPCQPLPKQT